MRRISGVVCLVLGVPDLVLWSIGSGSLYIVTGLAFTSIGLLLLKPVLIKS